MDRGVLLEEQGAIDEDDAAYLCAVAYGAAAVSFINLGVLFEEQGDLVAAEEAYRRAVDFSEADISNTARSALLGLHREPQEPDAGRAANARNA